MPPKSRLANEKIHSEIRKHIYGNNEQGLTKLLKAGHANSLISCTIQNASGTSEQKIPPLAIALLLNKTNLLNSIIACGADVDLIFNCESCFLTPLIFCMVYRPSLVVDFLSTCRPNVNKIVKWQHGNESTALSIAVERSEFEIVKKLTSLDADINYNAPRILDQRKRKI